MVDDLDLLARTHGYVGQLLPNVIALSLYSCTSNKAEALQPSDGSGAQNVLASGRKRHHISVGAL
jgi:hypothetical protein